MVDVVITFEVLGTPAPQGSKRGFVNPKNGRVILVESSAKVRPWRQDVKAAALDAIASIPGFQALGGPLEVTIEFRLPRPGYHYGTGRNSNQLKPTAPTYVDKKPDLDKVERSTLDALTEAGVFRDDAQVAVFPTSKVYANGAPGAWIRVTTLAEVPHTVAATASDSEQGALL